MKSIFQKALFGATGVAFLSSSAMAAFTFNDGDIVLGFQATGGQGVSTSLYFNLGSSVGFKNNPVQGLLGSINNDLVAAYGANWFSRSDVYFGAIGNRTNSSATTDPGNPPTTEPGRTVYVSGPTIVVGGATLQATLSSGALAQPATQYAGLRTDLTNATNPSAIVDTAFGANVAQQVDDGSTTFDNSWTDRANTPGFSFGNLSNIEQVFGAGGSERLIDIQRMTPSTATTYITTIRIGSDGTISAVPEASTSLLVLGAAAFGIFRRRRNA